MPQSVPISDLAASPPPFGLVEHLMSSRSVEANRKIIPVESRLQPVIEAPNLPLRQRYSFVTPFAMTAASKTKPLARLLLPKAEFFYIPPA
jgi:hypothetical protein